MCANDNAQSKSGQGVAGSGGEATGLVPYTTSHTQATDQRTSTVFALQHLLAVSASEARLRRLKHHVRTASRLIKETMARSGAKWRAVFVTLTYRAAEQWRPKHIAAFLNNVRMWGDRQGVKVGYVWVAEMQKRGVIHYHAVVWVPSRLQLPKPDRRGWWPHGSTNVQSVKRNAIGYLMKYVSKGVGDSPDLPQGARVCGSGGLDFMARNEFHYWRLPRYVRENISVGDRCSRVVGGGWMSRSTGEVWRSEFGVYAHSVKSRGKDCNGRNLRDDYVVLLSDKFKREKSARQFDPLLWDIIKERDWEKQRARESADAAASESIFWYETRASFVGSGSRDANNSEPWFGDFRVLPFVQESVGV